MSRIFISYRRADSEADANALYLSLKSEFGEALLFHDVDSIDIGEDFRQAIEDAIAESAALILVIGPQWLARDKEGRLRLARESDPIRLEIELARARHLPILPIRVRGAEMPDAEELPDGMGWLSYRNAWEVQHSSWGRDLAPVIERLRGMVSPAQPPAVGAGQRGSGERSPAPDETPGTRRRREVAEDEPAPAEPARRGRRVDRRVIGAIVVVAALALGGTVLAVMSGGGGSGSTNGPREISPKTHDFRAVPRGVTRGFTYRLSGGPSTYTYAISAIAPAEADGFRVTPSPDCLLATNTWSRVCPIDVTFAPSRSGPYAQRFLVTYYTQDRGARSRLRQTAFTAKGTGA